jgi:DNA-directed RNA polymerase specialized sigma24 family protein
VSGRPSSFHLKLVAANEKSRAFDLSLWRNPARTDDRVQETVLKAWDKIGTFEQAHGTDDPTSAFMIRDADRNT